jgi:integrase
MEQDMPTGLIRRGARYSTRRRIPVDLIEHYGGRAEIVRALNTPFLAEAKRLHALMWVALDQEFDAARAAIAPQSKPAAKPADVAELAARAVQSLRARRDEAAKAGALEGFIEYQREQLAYQQAVLDGVEPAEQPLPVHEAHRNAVQALLSGDGAMALAAVVQPVEEEGENPRVSELLARWLKEERPPSTVKEMQRAVDRFIKVIGDKRIKAVSRRDVTAFSDKLREPGGVTPGGVSIPTTNTTLSLVSALFGMAVKRNLIDHNPARGTQLKDPQKAREKRREFDAAALAAIFGSPIYAQGERPDGGAGEAAYWLPLLALYTGARINELCQLHPANIYEEQYLEADGEEKSAWVILFEENRSREQRLKNQGSERRIPIHPHLVDLGFVTYAQEQNGKDRLFDKLTAGPNEPRIAGNWGRWFARYLRNTCDVTDERMTFHSFRHSFKHYARMSHIPKDLHDLMTGHVLPAAADDYGGLTYPLNQLVPAIERYRVPGFKLPPPPLEQRH